jgi:hypothetical protein
MPKTLDDLWAHHTPALPADEVVEEKGTPTPTPTPTPVVPETPAKTTAKTTATDEHIPLDQDPPAEKEDDWADEFAAQVEKVTEWVPPVHAASPHSLPQKLADKVTGTTPEERRAQALRVMLGGAKAEAKVLTQPYRTLFRHAVPKPIQEPLQEWAHEEVPSSLGGAARTLSRAAIPAPNTDMYSDVPFEWMEELARGITGSEAPLDEEGQEQRAAFMSPSGE